MADLRRTEDSVRRSARRPSERPGRLSAKERKQLEAITAPRSEDLEAYRELLKEPRTGIVRLFPDNDCESRQVVRLDGDCVGVIPGTSSHRFRKSGVSRDIFFKSGLFVVGGFFTNSIITELGDVSLESVANSTSGFGFLVNYVPAAEFDQARKQYREMAGGVVRDGRVYANRSFAKPDTTYALRIIAYRNGNNLQKRMAWYRREADWSRIDESAPLYWRMREDVRIDMTIAFRVIRKDADGSLTLVWKELVRRDSPKITFPDGVRPTDFK